MSKPSALSLLAMRELPTSPFKSRPYLSPQVAQNKENVFLGVRSFHWEVTLAEQEAPHWQQCLPFSAQSPVPTRGDLALSPRPEWARGGVPEAASPR